MAVVNLPLSYETVLELVKQLPPDEQRELAVRLLELDAPVEDLSELSNGYTETHHGVEQWLADFEKVMIRAPLAAPLSDRREDWYGDEGR